MRREFDLPPEDVEYLEAGGLPWETSRQGGMWLLIHEYPIPPGYTNSQSSAALKIPSGYPDAQIDMVFFYPHLTLRNGRAIAASQAVQKIDGKDWQRWSRHRTSQNPWRCGVDCVATHMQQVDHWLQRELAKN